jgi:catechol 2,3-dioxygenase-like lactoylglutathione lyase family enzyme
VFDHVTIRVRDRSVSAPFYDALLGSETIDSPYYDEWDDFSLAQANDDHPVTRGLHVGFAAVSREGVDAFHRRGLEAGGRDDGAPGERDYTPDYYGGFLLDPDGNSVEAVHHEDVEGGGIDHLWIRVADPEAVARFYETLAPYTGFERAGGTYGPHFEGTQASFSLIAGDEPSQNIHIAFPAYETATVEAFHAAALAAGYRDNGAPGERPIYHPGYYAAFVFDPAGHNIEVVNHNR